MKPLRVLVLVHEDLVPPDTVEGIDLSTVEWRTEYEVVSTLRELGHEVRPLGVQHELAVIRQTVDEWKPHIAFNLLEEFSGVAIYDQNVVAYLELLKVPYAGCNPRGLMLPAIRVWQNNSLLPPHPDSGVHHRSYRPIDQAAQGVIVSFDREIRLRGGVSGHFPGLYRGR